MGLSFDKGDFVSFASIVLVSVNEVAFEDEDEDDDHDEEEDDDNEGNECGRPESDLFSSSLML